MSIRRKLLGAAGAGSIVSAGLIGNFLYQFTPSYVTHVMSPEQLGGVVVAFFVALIAFIGAATETKQRISRRAKPFRLTASFRGAMYGGLIGGAIAGAIISLTYYIKYYKFESVKIGGVAEVFVYIALMGAILGCICQFFNQLFEYFVSTRKWSPIYFNSVTGSISSCLIAGTLLGILVSSHFYDQDPPPIDLWIIAVGALVTPLFVVGGILFYDCQGRPQNLDVMALVWGLMTVFVGCGGVYLLKAFGAGTEEWWETIGAWKAGAILGSVIGALLGFMVGFTLYFYQLNQSTTKTKS